MDSSLENQQQSSISPRKARTIQLKRLKHANRLKDTDRVAIAAMKEAGMSAMDAAKATGTHVATIYRAWENPELKDLAPSVVRSIKTGLGGLFYKRGLESTLAISPEKIAQSSALQLATVAGIMTEKGRLMEGLSTDNVSFRGVSQSIEEDRAKIMARFKDIET